MEPGQNVPWSRGDRIAALALGGAATAFWLWFGAAHHPLLIGGAESDRYVPRAAALLAGTDDAMSLWHPFGLPLAIAGVARVTGLDCFAAAKMLSAIAGGALVACTYALARRFCGRIAAVLCALAAALQAEVFLGAVQATSDVPGAALCLLGVLAFARATDALASVPAHTAADAMASLARAASAPALAPERISAESTRLGTDPIAAASAPALAPGRISAESTRLGTDPVAAAATEPNVRAGPGLPSKRPVMAWTALGGLCLGAAVAVRWPAAVFAVAVVPLLLRGPWAERARIAAAAAGGAAVGFLPHALAAIAHGRGPFEQSQWHNLLLKNVHGYDVQSLHAASAVLHEQFAQWPQWLLPSAGDALAHLGSGLADPWLPDVPLALAIAASLAVLAALALPFVRRDRAALVLALPALVQPLVVAATFRPEDRLLAPSAVLQLVLVLAAARALQGLAGRAGRAAPALLAAGALAAGAAALPEALRRFASQHRSELVAALQELVRTHDRMLTVQSTFPWTGHYADCRAVLLHPLPRGSGGALQWARAAECAAPLRPDFVVLDERADEALLRELLSVPLPEGLVVERRGGAVLFADRAPRPAWCAEAEVAAGGETVTLRLTLLPEVRSEDVADAGFHWRSIGGRWHEVRLPRTGERTFGATVPLSSVPRGEHEFAPALVRRDGAVWSAPALRRTLRPSD